MMIKGNWVQERSSGYLGYRCTVCGTWIYENQPRICDCKQEKDQTMNITYECWGAEANYSFALKINGVYQDTVTGFKTMKEADAAASKAANQTRTQEKDQK